MKVGIIGSRTRNTRLDYTRLLLELACLKPVDEIVTGDCEDGWDKFAREIAGLIGTKLTVKYRIDPLTMKKLKRYVPDYYEFCQINYNRNEEIAKEDLDVLLAAVTPDRKGGTENTIKYFKKHHKDWKEKLKLC